MQGLEHTWAERFLPPPRALFEPVLFCCFAYPLQTSCLHHFLLPFTPQRDDMTTQFNQMSLSRQSSGDNSESPSGPVYPSPLLQQPAQQPGYIMASPSQQLPPGGFTGSGPPVSQQVLQPQPPPQGFVQQPPPPAQVGKTLAASLAGCLWWHQKENIKT